MPSTIPRVVIDRLPVYSRMLALLERQGRQVVSSQEMGEELGVTPAQIRKDLSYFGRFGKQGRGYNVQRLGEELRTILGLDRQWTMTLVGVGDLGRAILSYRGFSLEGFRIVSAFDCDPVVVGEKVGDVLVRDVSELPSLLRRRPVDIGIVAVPASAAQDVIDRLARCGVKAILNYAPISPRVPPEVRVRHIEPVLTLQSMTHYLKECNRAKPS
jgi:redox-sensing transcriptional repressor